MKTFLNTVKTFFFVFFVQQTFAHIETIQSIYNDALNFDQNIEVARGKVMQMDGIYREDLWDFLPAPLVSYSQERRDITYKNKRSTVSHPGSYDLIVMQSISAPKVFSAMSADKFTQSSRANYKHLHDSLLGIVTTQITIGMMQFEALKSNDIKIKQLQDIYQSELEKHSTNTTNINLLKTSLENAKVNRSNIQISLETSLNNMYLTTGKQYQTLPKAPGSSKLINLIHLRNLDYYKDNVAKYNQAIKATKLKVVAEKYRLKATKGNFLPYISYDILYNKNESQDDNITSDLVKDSFVTSLGLTYDFGANPGKVTQQKGTLMRAQAESRQTNAEQFNLANNNFKRITMLKNNIRQLEKTITQSDKTLVLMKNEYSNGKIFLSDLIEFIDQQNDIRNNLVTSRYQLIQNYTTLLITSGFNSNSIATTIDDIMSTQANLKNVLN